MLIISFSTIFMCAFKKVIKSTRDDCPVYAQSYQWIRFSYMKMIVNFTDTP